jgi:hypothetical protein
MARGESPEALSSRDVQRAAMVERDYRAGAWMSIVIR